MVQSRPSIMLSSIASGVFVLAAMGPCGCAGTPRSDSGGEKTSFNDRPGVQKTPLKADGTKGEDAGADADAVASRIEQDVADFMALREKATARGDGATAGVTPPSTTRRPNGRPVIDWGDRHSTAPDKVAREINGERGPIGVAMPVGQEPLASDTEQLPVATPTVPTEMNELIVALSRELYQDAAYADMPLRQLLLIASLTMTDPERTLNPDAIPGLTEEEREILGQFQTFFTKLGSDLDAGDRSAEVVVQDAVTRLRDGLVRQPRLGIGSALLCTRVGGFGDFSEFKRDADDGMYRFLAHHEQPAVVYVEVEQFTSELNKNGEWVTELSQHLVIYSDRDGIPVWKQAWEPAVDRSRNRRQDFFTVQIITLPKELGVGKYHLKIRCRDEKSGAETETSIPFEMVADASMAVSGR